MLIRSPGRMPAAPPPDRRGALAKGDTIGEGRSSRPSVNALSHNRQRSGPARTGALAGGRTFACDSCGYLVTLLPGDEPPDCPTCGPSHFVPTSMFSEGRTEMFKVGEPAAPGIVQPDWVAEARASMAEPGDYLAFEHDEGPRVVALPEGFTRLGRSLAAELRFDHPTVSRRHAMVHREGVRVSVVDDRSLNGVFVNGERVDWRTLQDGDEIALGRFHLYFIRARGGSSGRFAGR